LPSAGFAADRLIEGFVCPGKTSKQLFVWTGARDMSAAKPAEDKLAACPTDDARRILSIGPSPWKKVIDRRR
jgi:hypothetical protein